MKGQIINCVNHGTLIQVLIKTENGLESIHMDHRCFWHMVEAKGDIRGKEVEYDQENKRISFTEDQEI